MGEQNRVSVPSSAYRHRPERPDILRRTGPGHDSTSITLDVHADLFDDDLDAVAGLLAEAAKKQSVGKTWAALLA
ncbi:MAG: hypothetical protein ACRDT7_18235 [Microbacterium sp.]